MPDVRQHQPRSRAEAGDPAGGDPAGASLSGVRGTVRVCPNGRDGCRCIGYRGSSRDRDEADDFLIEAAQREGALCEGGIGLREWYRRGGILEPEYARRVVARKEITGRDVGALIDRHSGEEIP